MIFFDFEIDELPPGAREGSPISGNDIGRSDVGAIGLDRHHSGRQPFTTVGGVVAQDDKVIDFNVSLC